MKKDYTKWHKLKTGLNQNERTLYFHEREIWWCSVGLNIGYEQDGKNQFFERPVLIIRKFNLNIFLGLPMTSHAKKSRYYHELNYRDRKSFVILSQIRLFDKKKTAKEAPNG